MTDLRTARVLLVGTGRHGDDSGLAGVPAVGATLQALRRALIDRCGVAPGNVRVLLDPADPMAMGDAVATVTEQATDVLLVYFVGHGLVGTDATLHLAVKSSNFRPNRIPHTALPFRTVREYIRDSVARSKIVVLDCCWGGLAIETLGADGSQFAEMSRIEGTFVLTAAGAHEKAWASGPGGFTRFSGAVLRWLADGEPDGGAELTLDAMYRGVRGDLLSRGGPEPQRRSTGGVGDLVVMCNPAYVPDPPPVRPAVAAPPAAAAPLAAAAPPARAASAARRRRWTPRRQLLAGLAALTVLGPVAGYGVRQVFGTTCVGSVQLAVGVAPEIADVVADWAETWIDGLPQSASEPCVILTVKPASPVAVAASLVDEANRADGANRTVTGLDPPKDDWPVPDVWIPDSSLWLERVRAVDRSLVPAAARSIAHSPIVIAVPGEFAPATGWLQTAPSWSDLQKAIINGSVPRPGIVDPVVDASGLVMLRAMEPKSGGEAALVRRGIFKTLNTGRTELRGELLSRLGYYPAVDRPVVNMAALPEYAVDDYNAENPKKPLALVRPTPPLATSLDYPYTVLPATRSDKARMAARFGESLSGASFLERLRANSFHPPSAAVGPKTPAIDTVLASWIAVVRAMRVLLVVDVSASAARTVPDAGGASRLEVASKSLAEATALMDDTSWAGLWSYSARKVESLVPMGPLSQQRLGMQTTLAGFTAIKDSRNKVTDAILAGYKDAQRGWQPGLRNLVLVVAAGDGPDLGKLTTELARLKDPLRPVGVAVVALGSGLRSTSEIQVYPAAKGSEANESILRALSET